MKVVIVGGVAGGASAAARLRRLDEAAEIIMFERGEYVSYANCGLPYYVGGVIKDRERLLVQTPESLRASLNIDVRVLHEVLHINREQQSVTIKNLQTGEVLQQDYDFLVLSPGADPFVPPIDALETIPHFSVRTVSDTDRISDFIATQQPKRAVVLGGGFVGVEMAENLVERGIQVALVEMASQVLPMLDREMAALVHKHMHDHGLGLYLGRKAVAIVRDKDGRQALQLDNGESLELDLLILAAGVRPNSSLARQAGLALGQNGAIEVNAVLQTSDPRIYAVGDAVEVVERVSGCACQVPLAGPANKQGRMVADHIAGRLVHYPGAFTTSIIKVFDLTVASTGLTEAKSRNQGVEAGTAIIHPQSHAGYYPGGTPMTLKLIYDLSDGRVLGAQGVGQNGVDKRIDVISTAMHFGGSVRDLQQLDLAYAPPFSSAKDPVNMIGYVAGNVLAGDVEQIAPQEWLASDHREFTVLDIREQLEYQIDHWEGALHIPLKQLRDRLNEVPKNKTVLVYCQVGLRAYLAARILKQAGYQVRNLSGGFKMLRALEEDLATPCSQGTVTFAQPEKDKREQEAGAVQSKVTLDACGLQCPGPIMQVYHQMQKMEDKGVLEVHATDPAFLKDVESWCRVTGNTLLSSRSAGGRYTATVRKGSDDGQIVTAAEAANKADGKTMVVFSGDLDKAIASFIIANGAAAMGKPVTMFFTFWGLNVLRQPVSVPVKKGFLDRMFSMMMPRGSKRLGLSKMNMLGMGPLMIRHVMNKKQVSPLEDLIMQAKRAGIRMVACQMSMDVMGIKHEELIDGVEIGGVATFLDSAERSNMSLFI